MNAKIELREVSVMLSLIGTVFYNYPERAFYERLFSENVFAEIPAELDNDDFQSGCALLNKCNASPEDFGTVETDYMRLFVMGDKFTAPPWQSIYLSPDKLMFQPSTLKVREWYKKYNIMAKCQYNEPDDHAGLMLIFAAHLAETAENNSDAAVMKDFNDYCSEQILNWIPSWCNLIVQHAKTDFFKGLAILTKGILQAL